MAAMKDMDTAADDSTPASAESGGSRCRHCGGSGREPQALEISFSRSGATRGELAQLAEASGVSAPTISSMLRGRKTPSVAVLVAIAEALGRWIGEPVTVDRIIRIPAVWKRVRASRRATVKGR